MQIIENHVKASDSKIVLFGIWILLHNNIIFSMRIISKIKHLIKKVDLFNTSNMLRYHKEE